MALTRRLLPAAVVLSYLAVYYAVEPVRLAYWGLLFLPDEVWSYWTAGRGTISLVDRLPIWLTLAAYLTAAYSLGRLLLRAGPLPALTALERFVFALTLGLSGWSLVTLLVGLAGGLHVAELFRGAALLVVAGEIGLVVRDHRHRTAVATASRTTTASAGQRWRPRWSYVVVGGFAVMYLLAGTLPPLDFDVREYHLQVPKEWYQAGTIGFLPHNVYGNMPLGAEMHALACMQLWLGSEAWWYGALAGKGVISLFAPLTALALLAAGERFYSRPAGLLAALLYLAFPWIAHVSFHGLIDAVVAHYVFAAVYASLLAGNVARGYWLAGALGGSAAACKYPGLIFAAPPVLGVMLWQARATALPTRHSASLAVALACVLAGFAVAGGPWYVKNAVFTGNPVYPLAGRWLDRSGVRSAEQVEQWNRAHQIPRDADGRRFSPAQFGAALAQVGWRSEWLSPIAWPLGLIGVVATWQKRETRVLAATAIWIFAVWWLATHRIDRFWLPAVPLLCLLGGAAWQGVDTPAARRSLAGLTGLGLIAATLMLLAPIVIGERLHVISNPYWLAPLDDVRQGQLRPSHRQLIDAAGSEQGVLLVGDAAPFDLPMPCLYSTCFDRSPFELLTRGRSPQEIRQQFQQHKIAFVLVDWQEIRRYRSPGNYGFTDYVQPSIFARLMEQGVLEPLAASSGSGEQRNWEIYTVRE